MRRTKDTQDKLFISWVFLGVVAPLYFRILGEVFLIDLIALGFLLRIGLGTRNASNLVDGKLKSVGLFWAISIVGTDLYRNIPPIHTLKALAMVFAFFVLLKFFLTISIKQLKSFLVGYWIGFGITSLLKFKDGSIELSWKMGLGFAALALVILLLSSSSLYWLVPFSLVGLSYMSLDLQSRSLALVSLTSAALITLRIKPNKKLKAKKKHISSLIVIVLIVFGFQSFYTNFASTGWFGESTQEKYFSQSATDAPLILSGRKEFFFYSNAILKSPIIGYGTMANLPPDIFQLAEEELKNLGFPSFEILRYYGTDQHIPTHSFVFAAWTFHGIPGLLFWLFLAFRISKVIYQLPTRNLDDRGIHWIMILLAVNFFWDILFSPFASFKRVEVAALVALCYALYPKRSAIPNVSKKINFSQDWP